MQINYRVLFFVLAIFLFAISGISSTHAQILNGIDLSLSTLNPSPGQAITITAQSFGNDIQSAKITWTVNNKTVLSGIGETKYETSAPEMGKKLNVSVSATLTSGYVIRGSIVVQSGTVDMILEPDGYVPPFFRGKINTGYQNGVKIIAVPHLANSSGVEYDPKTLVYKWERSGRALSSDSGYGKQSIFVPGDIMPSEFSIKVTVQTRDSSAQATGIVTISPVAPQLAFYENDPLYGPLFNSALGNQLRIGSERETGILAVPFGFNGKNSLTYTWFINGDEHPELAAKDSVILRAPAESAGNSEIMLRIQNEKQILQGTRGTFSVFFSADPNANMASSTLF